RQLGIEAPGGKLTRAFLPAFGWAGIALGQQASQRAQGLGHRVTARCPLLSPQRAFHCFGGKTVTIVGWNTERRQVDERPRVGFLPVLNERVGWNFET